MFSVTLYAPPGSSTAIFNDQRPPGQLEEVEPNDYMVKDNWPIAYLAF